MACFLTPLVVGVAVAVVSKLWRGARRFRLDILAYLMLGGALILAVEHAWHGEVVPYPPFLTAMKNPEDIPVMLREVSVVGTSMTLAVTATWLGIVGISRKLETVVKSFAKITATLEAKQR